MWRSTACAPYWSLLAMGSTRLSPAGCRRHASPVAASSRRSACGRETLAVGCSTSSCSGHGTIQAGASARTPCGAPALVAWVRLLAPAKHSAPLALELISIVVAPCLRESTQHKYARVTSGCWCCFLPLPPPSIRFCSSKPYLPMLHGSGYTCHLPRRRPWWCLSFEARSSICLVFSLIYVVLFFHMFYYIYYVGKNCRGRAIFGKYSTKCAELRIIYIKNICEEYCDFSIHVMSVNFFAKYSSHFAAKASFPLVGMLSERPTKL